MPTNLLTLILDDHDAAIEAKLAESVAAINAIRASERKEINDRLALAQTNILAELAELAGVAAVAAPRVYPRAKSKAKRRAGR